MAEAKHTPFFVGAQNDAMYIIAGERPSLNNDYPRHDANRTPIAKVYEEQYAPLLAAAPQLLDALEMLYDKWENGDPRYEDPDTLSGSLGNAFRLSEEEESLILNLLKRAGR